MKKIMTLVMSALMLVTGCTDTVLDETDTTEHVEIVDEAEVKADNILRNMSIEEKVCQMMFVTPESITGVSGVTMAGETTRLALEKYPVGGIIYFSQNIKSREQVISMIENSQSYSSIPLFIGVDEEGGRVARIGSKAHMGTTKIPPMRNVKSTGEAFRIGQTLGRDLSALSFNVDFAPVADVIVYEKNSEIGDRSFGSDPYVVGEMVKSVVEGMEGENVSSVLKHFPGHGSTRTDSHTGYSQSERTLEELRSCELLPFEKGIEAGCDFVMVSHMTLINATEEKVPASLSGEIITRLLKDELGFSGIVITDSLSMGAITKEYKNSLSAVMAVKAGADMLLMPQNVEEAKNAILNAVTTGEITIERIDESVKKILKIKIEKGLL
ncbi:MAG: glycoside hydrolase family 3 protein [Clostridia bacterium]|nr:glycoside hydrolase family 3 protein [Clostridia bacterium]